MTAVLHVLLGPGGVGKTTLAAGYALALAAQGRKVGLLGVDPARRLRTALGLDDLPETEVPIAPGLTAALVRPEQSLRRWAAEEDAPAELLASPFFVALADRLAAASETIAAARAAEWVEKDPALQDLVIDTAPGLQGIDFLERPEKLSAFLEGRVLEWARRLVAPARGPFSGTLRAGARRALGAIGRIGGTRLLVGFAEFAVLIEAVAGRMLERLARARTQIRDGELLVVATARAAASDEARALALALGGLGLSPAAAVLNRALPDAISAPEAPDAESRAVLRFAANSARVQQRVGAQLAAWAPRVIEVPAASGLDAEGAARLAALTQLGEHLRNPLALAQTFRQAARH